jgi:hypothetical protein
LFKISIFRLSIFFRLPYWCDLKVNHLLDPMHIFKNVTSSIFDHLIGSKDSLAIREDLQSIGRLKEAWPIKKTNSNVTFKRAPWTLTALELKKVKEVICKFRTPTGHMRYLRGAFSKSKKRGCEQLIGLKSHDWHKMA